ncbi:response regulator [Ferrovibrio sp.]|uniref:response regulator n=1 Tax=Ferrovibrio sp. TaxID=1917215 RepID=UPI00311DC0C4
MAARPQFDRTAAVLVVDDHRTMQAIICSHLRRIGFAVVDAAGDAVTALTMLRQRRYGLVLSDWNMEPMDGIALLRSLRADPVYARVPFILVTAESRPDQVLAAQRHGVDGYLVKPFDRAGLQRRIDALAQP